MLNPNRKYLKKNIHTERTPIKVINPRLANTPFNDEFHIPIFIGITGLYSLYVHMYIVKLIKKSKLMELKRMLFNKGN